jgi:ssDNA-binding Zn-finger/Zn-ribbon topoisomerase 1
MNPLPQRAWRYAVTGEASLLDVARCPKCEAPMTIRVGKQGPYFACRCKPPVAASPPAVEAPRREPEAASV